MFKYLLKRILVMIPTLLGITVLSFVILNLAPGGPIEQKIQQMRFGNGGESGNKGGDAGISEEMRAALNKQYGFDKPLPVRYLLWLKNVVTLNFGESFIYEEPAIDVIVSKFPVSIQFGLVSLFLTYLVCIPLGILKAMKDGSAFDGVSSFVLFLLYSVPPLMLGVLLIVYFAGGSYFSWFPLEGIVSDNYDTMSFIAKVGDRVWHFILPTICYMVGSFTLLTFMMKNSILDEIRLDYVRTARAKGSSERTVVYKHVLRNALIPLVTGFGSSIGLFLAGSLIIERLFTLDGIGLLSYKATLDRDYNVIMALIFISSLVSLFGRLISDLLYVVVDPRIDFD